MYFEYFCTLSIGIVVQALPKHFGSGQCKRILILNPGANEIDKELTWLCVISIELERHKIEHRAFIVQVRLKNHPAAKIDCLEDV